MADIYAVQILKVYIRFLLALADSAFGRLNYDILVRYLTGLAIFNRRWTSHQICSEWIVKYPTVKVMVRNLSNLL